MKLTKGKITKLYNKKRQTLKKKNNKKIRQRGRTFRGKRPMNLARRTLKNFSYTKGGEGKLDEEAMTGPGLQEVGDGLQEVGDGLQEVVGQGTDRVRQESVPLEDSSTLETNEEASDNNVNDNISVSEEESDVKKILDQNNTYLEEWSSSEKATTDSAKIEPETQIKEETQQEPEPESETEIQPESETEINSESETEIRPELESRSSQNVDVIQALNTVVDHIVDIATEKVTENMEAKSQTSQLSDDGFESVSAAAETMANSNEGGVGGGKSRRKRMRLTKKTRRIV
jgi:hypothetical protein